MDCSVADFYKNKNILLTGGTGFLGKITIQKLLTTCDVGTIFLLVRTKKGIKPSERIENMLKEPVFDRLRKEMGRISNKIHLIKGDLKEKGLGISQSDKHIIQTNVEVVFHCGASLNMDAALRDLVLTNVRSTSELLSVMQEAKNLQAFVLVSTAYSWCVHNRIEERFYDAPISPQLLVKLAEDLEEDVMDSISKGIIGDWPNSYTFSKAVAENVVLEQGKKLPVALLRPSIVTSAAFDPLSGWTDNLYGPLGIILSEHCGVLRVVPGDPRIRADTVPADMVVNAILCLAWDVHKKWYRDDAYIPPVLNFSGNRSDLYVSIRKYTEDIAKTEAAPFQKALWHPMLFIIENKFWYFVLKFVLHTVPAHILDVMTIVVGGKPRMCTTYSKLDKLTSVLRYFLFNEWNIEDKNVLALWNSLNESDRKFFPFDVAAICAPTYYKSLLLGLKLYIAKEDISKMKSHKQKFKRLELLHYAIKYMAWFLVSYPVFKRCWHLLFQMLLRL